MNATTQPRTRRIEGVVPERSVLGLSLLAIGSVVLAGFLVADIERFTLVAISAILLIAFAVTREYGFAVPAGITGGLGTAVLFISAGTFGPAATTGVLFLSIAGGFATIWLLGLLAAPQERHPWPLVPAVILGSIGLAFVSGQPGALSWIQVGIAALIIVAGAGMLLRRDHAA